MLKWLGKMMAVIGILAITGIVMMGIVTHMI